MLLNMTAVTHGTPSLALPATQNTAPVHEFRCLYTHDVRKKAKKWHDGSTRFHTFNKRVMVYDDAKNFIGDLHYRADEEFGEGIELQLDRGVLVEVGERMGETQTDLTGIVHKPHGEHITVSSTLASSCSRPVSRANYLNSESRPKSLTEVLGPSQGRIGRATLPQTSPFEHRRVLHELQHNGPPYKRQKILIGKENGFIMDQQAKPLVSAQTSSSPGRPHSLLSSPHINKERQRKSPTIARPVEHGQSVIDISSDDGMQPVVAKTSAEKPGKGKTPSNNSQPTREAAVLDSSAKDVQIQEREISRTSINRRQHKITRTTDKLRRPSGQLRSSDKPSSNSKQCTSSLKMVSQKPRRKLMYKALLPINSTQDEGYVLLDKVRSRHHAGKGNHNHEPDPEMQPEMIILPSVIDQEMLDEPDGSGPSVQPATFALSPERVLDHTELPSNELHHSPLFISQRPSQRSPTPVPIFLNDDFNIPATQDLALDHSFILSDDDDTAIQLRDECNILEPDSPCFPPPPPRSKATEAISPAPMPPPKLLKPAHVTDLLVSAVQRTPSPVKSRSLTQSLSANDSSLPFDPSISPASIASKDLEELLQSDTSYMSPLQPPPPQKTRQTHGSSSSNSPFQRCRSDKATLLPPNIITVAQPSSAEEQGPWTTFEAFLLFGEWPACKQKAKPVLGSLSAEDAKQVDELEFSPVCNKAPPVFIRNARSFMRDG